MRAGGTCKAASVEAPAVFGPAGRADARDAARHPQTAQAGDHLGLGRAKAGSHGGEGLRHQRQVALEIVQAGAGPVVIHGHNPVRMRAVGEKMPEGALAGISARTSRRAGVADPTRFSSRTDSQTSRPRG